jgi:hypothetical protein
MAFIEWFQMLPAINKNLIVQNWQTLKNATMVHFMNATWCAKEQSNAFRMRFCDSKNHDESLVEYVIRKKMHLTLLQPTAFDQLIHEIVVIGALPGWVTIVRPEELGRQWTEFIKHINNHSQALIDAKAGSNLLGRLEKLEQGQGARSHFTKPNKSSGNKFRKDKKGNMKAAAREALVGFRKDLPEPNFKSSD